MTHPAVIRVVFLQPLIPHYRLAFFRGLAAERDLDLTVHASRETPGRDLKSVEVDPRWFRVEWHDCRRLGGQNRPNALWQSGLHLPSGFGRGDVLVLPGTPRYLSGLVLALRARLRGASVLWFGQGFSASNNPSNAAIRRSMMRLADEVVLYTDREVELYRAIGFPAGRLSASNNALDQSAISKAAAEWSAQRLEAFVANAGLTGRRILLLVGRLIGKTNAGLLLRAVASLPTTYTAVVVGDGPERAALANHAATFGLGDRARFIGSLYSEDALAPWFLAAAAFVYPGTIGLSILHAFGYGLPVITHGDWTDHGPEFATLRPGENGAIFRPGDVSDLVTRIIEVAEAPPERRAAMSMAARQVTEVHSMPRMVERFATAIRRAAGRRRHQL